MIGLCLSLGWDLWTVYMFLVAAYGIGCGPLDKL